ncbi:hypothetical protein [Aquibacillus saliphilus]|uniref:hypothetical protein n=1 Tax=Aquibacillus saliphilus TaxID=1909422 RepID=UPI001CF0B2D2|nr:hypothetical protein [Aquibacillus saliphilus]
MKKLTASILLLIVLFGCQSKEVSTFQLEGEIAKINISESNGFYETNPNFFIELTDDNAVQVFTKAITTSEKQMGTFDMIDPEYDMRIVYANGNKHNFHLWLGEKSTLMELENTETIYYVSSELTDKLTEFIK